TRSGDPETSANGPGRKRGAAPTAVRAYGKRRQEKGSRTTSVESVTDTRASEKSQCAGAARSLATRRIAPAIAGAARQRKRQERKSGDAVHALHRPGTTAPVTGSVRSGVAYTARASVVSSRPAARPECNSMNEQSAIESSTWMTASA